MEISYLLIVVFLFALAIVDLWVGVSNDAVNFISSAVGCKAAKLKHVLFVAAAGVFMGAAFSNGMMEVARSGIFNPSEFYFSEVMCIFLAVMVSDVFLLDLFNSLGLPTSTTVSLVFELLGAAFIVAIIKMFSGGADMDIVNLLNTDKALVMIISIFLSVAVAFVFGLVVQWISRLIFTFHFRRNLGRKIGIFGGIAVTSIVYFMLIKGLKGTTIVPADVKDYIDNNLLQVLGGCFLFFTLLMQLLHWCRVNVLKVVVLIGTFSLALAFAGNDLVNFIGVTLAGFDSFITYSFNNPAGLAADQFTMESLAGAAKTPVYFLFGAGVIMVVALCTSKKALKVLQTSIDLSTQSNDENEIFGTSPIARNLVRTTTKVADAVVRAENLVFIVALSGKVDRCLQHLQRLFAGASVNLVLGGLLIAVGTSLKLPLSTTYITFMVAMGSSLADRAWGRESAVYRVTGVISVIGGWFVTAGAAFILGALVASIMYYGGIVAMYAMIALVIYLLIHSHIKYNKKKKEEQDDVTMQIVLRSDDEAEVWNALKVRTAKTLSSSLLFSADTYKRMFEAFAKDSLRPLKLSLIKIVEEKAKLKKQRRLETRGLQRIDQQLSFERSTWYHLCTNSCQQMLNTLTRIGEPMKEHADNSFSPLSKGYIEEFSPYCRDVYNVLMDINHMVESGCYDNADEVSARAKELKHSLATLRKTQTRRLQGNKGSLRMDFEYLNIIQESHELLSEVRNLLRGSNKYFAPVA